MPMGAFGSIVPVVTVGSISKRWIIPGWRIGWLVTTDPTGILLQSGVSLSLSSLLYLCLCVCASLFHAFVCHVKSYFLLFRLLSPLRAILISPLIQRPSFRLATLDALEAFINEYISTELYDSLVDVFQLLNVHKKVELSEN